MTRWLGVDSSTDALSLVLGQGELTNNFSDSKVIASQFNKENKQHGQSLVASVQALLAEVSWTVADIEAVVVGIGPGSYTGLRIGITFAKVWATSLAVPLYEVSSLALQISSAPIAPVIISLMDARRLSAYIGLYSHNPINNRLENLQADCHGDFKEWLQSETVSQILNDTSQVLIVGHDTESFIQVFQEIYSKIELDTVTTEEALPHVERVFNLSMVGQLNRCTDPHTLAPNYAHATLAEQNWAQDHQRRVASRAENEAFIDHYKTTN